jgi:class 3 adenylate cyclase
VSSLPSGTVTFLFTDIEGSTALLRELGDRYADVLGRERSILRETLTDAGGQEIDTQGDAFFFSFTRARDAVTGAVAAQRALAENDWPDGVDVKVRMGLHTGEPSVGDEGYVGLDVVRAARICSAGHGGQILLSETTRDLGTQSLKDVGEERIYQLTVDGREDFAPLEAERRLGPSKADILGDDFEQRVEAFVRRSIDNSFASGKPQEKAKSFWSRFGRRA